jgi:hypothetical protein
MNLRWLKQNLILLIATVVFLVVLAGMIWLGRGAAAPKADVEEELGRQNEQLTRLRGLDPAPSAENIDAVRRERELVQRLYRDLQSGAVREAINVPALKRPIEFSQLLRDTVARLTQQAGRNQVKTPDNFLFGFSRYDTDFPCRQAGISAGDCKKMLDLLAKQLVIIEKLSGLLMDSHVEEIAYVHRTEVEPGATSADALTAQIATDPKGLYQTYPFELSFTGDTKSLRAFLNSLAKSDWFFAVRTVKIDSTSATSSTAGSAAPPTGRPDPNAPAEPAQTVEWRRLTVTVRIDLVEFTAPATKPAAR